jgi:hypothetical protein
MIRISQVVTDIVSGLPFVAESLDTGLINLSGLARQIRPDVEKRLHKKVNEGALLMALKRYAQPAAFKQSRKIPKILAGTGEVIVRSAICQSTFRNSTNIFKKLNAISGTVTDRDVMFTYVRGVFETTVVASSILQKKIQKKLSGEEILTEKKNLSSVTLRLPAENIEQPGLYYFILRCLGWEGINILEVISTSNEFTVVVRNKDIEKTFSILNRLKAELV